MMKDMDIIRDRLCRLLSAEDERRGMGTETLLSLASLPGRVPGSLRFSDLDYASENRSAWPLHDVLDRIRQLSVCYYLGDADERDRLYPVISALLLDWVCEGYPNSNWWQLEIGAPKQLTAILLLLGDRLSPELREMSLHHIARGTIADRPEIALRSNGKHQGANLLWHCAISIRHAALTEDAEELRLAASLSAGETEGGKDVGLQEDGSFFQHGRLLYSVGYGRSFLRECATLIYVLAGTEFAFPRVAVERVLTHLLDGIRYMVAGRGVDFTCVGREYMRPGHLHASTLLPSIELLLAAEDIPRRDELLSFRDAIREGRLPLRGVKYFPIVKYLSLYTDKLHFSFKGTDPTLVNSEIINSENMLGYNFSYGTVSLVSRTGHEYDEIPNYWDYARIPGTTSRIENDAELLTYTDFHRPILTDDFGGGVKGDLGACYVTTVHEGVRATVAAFATPLGAVLLGCGISEESGAPLRTAVNQCRFEGDLAVKDGGNTVTRKYQPQLYERKVEACGGGGLLALHPDLTRPRRIRLRDNRDRKRCARLYRPCKYGGASGDPPSRWARHRGRP